MAKTQKVAQTAAATASAAIQSPTPAVRAQLGAFESAKAAPPASPYRILSIDGGGIRGIIALAILENLDDAKPGWRNGINMFAGTSTGALIGLALAKGMSPRDIMDVYIKEGPKVFDRSFWHEITNIGDAVGPKYDSANRETLCHSILGDSRLKDYLSADGTKGHVLVSAFNLHDPVKGRWKAKLFHNMPTNDGTDDGDQYAWRVAMRTSAAPTYFASYDGYVDGGVFANNPAMCALAQTQDPRNAMQIPITSVRMLSLGTGWYPKFIEGEESWGLAQWSTKIIDLIFDGVNDVDTFEAVKLLGTDNSVRVSPQMPIDIALDDTSKLSVLQQIGSRADISDALNLVSRW